MVGKYLAELENKKFMNVLMNTSPTKCSSFYWKNYHKYKAFIPTEKCKVYINLEEYDSEDIEYSNLDLKDRWILAKKCVCLALNETKNNKQVIHKMYQLIQLFKRKRKQIQLNDERNDEFSIPPGSRKFYILLVYRVKDIMNVPDKDRYKYAKVCERLSLSAEDQNLIDFIDSTFETISKRFAKDSNPHVYRY